MVNRIVRVRMARVVWESERFETVELAGGHQTDIYIPEDITYLVQVIS